MAAEKEPVEMTSQHPPSYTPPGKNDHDDYSEDVSTYEYRIFKEMTRPDDSYTPDGVYWADLPWMERARFVLHADRTIASQELRTFGSTIKNPLSLLSWFASNSVIPGAGLGLEGYVIFSIGILQPLFEHVWPECWSTYEVCSKNWVASVTYLEVIGFLVGGLTIGVIGDWMGRRFGLIQDAVLMLVSLIMLTASWGLTLQGWVICYALSLFVFSVGLGGEHPVTVTSSLEGAMNAGKISARDDRLHRGRSVTNAFLLQGWGQFFNQLLLIILLLIFNKGSGNPPYSDFVAQFVFRLSFAFPALFTLWMVYYRIWKMPHASRQLTAAKNRLNVTGYDFKALGYCYTHFGGRLIATAGAWFCSDVFFYGNKLFQGQFIQVISDNPNSLMTSWTWNLVNSSVALCGYYFATFLMDNRLYGRKKMQLIGFFMCFLMFIIPAFNYDYFTSPAGIRAFQALYFLSSFFGQFGPNCVTFIVGGEVYPTSIRATAHGFSTAVGKVGALFASVLYNYIDTQTKFHIVPWFGLAGMILTFIFLPDTTGLDLKEQERRWNYIREGKAHEYHGTAVHPKHLSRWERLRGLDKSYNPDLDWKAKIADIRAEWERAQIEKELEGISGDSVLEDDDFSQEMHEYLKRSSPPSINQRGVLVEMTVVNESSSK